MSQENKKQKNTRLLIILLFSLGALFLILGSVIGSSDKNNLDTDKFIENEEAKLEAFLMEVKGIKSVKVIITADVFSTVTDKYGQGENVYTYPTVKGVVVACTNGDSDRVKAEITEIVSKYLGIGANKVKVTDIKG